MKDLGAKIAGVLKEIGLSMSISPQSYKYSEVKVKSDKEAIRDVWNAVGEDLDSFVPSDKIKK